MKDVAKYDVGAITSRVASADTMQALTDRPNLRAVQNVTGAADNLSGMLAQSEQARTTALGTKREMQVGALEMARNKKAVDTLGLTSAASHERSRGLSIAARKQTENMAIGSALTELGTSYAYAKAYGEYEGLFNKTGKDPLPKVNLEGPNIY